MKMKKSAVVIIIAVLVVIIFLLVNNSNKNSKNVVEEFTWPDTFTESALEAKRQEEEVHANIKKAIDAVEKDYKSAHSNYSGYKRSDFYNGQRLSEQMENGEIEFVSKNQVNVECMYDIGGIKIDEIPSVVTNLADESSFDTGNLLLRCKTNMGIYTLYYLVTIGSNGLEKYNYVFYTENEIFDNLEIENELLDSE